MKRWNFAGIVAGVLLLGALVLLGCFFATELSNAFLDSENETTLSQISTTDGMTTEETTVEETTTEETTIEETTTEETTTEETTEDQQTSSGTGYSIAASHAFVYDVTSGTYLYEKGDSLQRIAPASVTKLFTAYVALQYLEPDTILTAGSEVEMINPASSRAYIAKGNQLTVEKCIQAMMMPSGNDAAYMISVAAGRAIGGQELSIQEAMDTFMNEVNQAAQYLGLTNTHFASPDGTDSADHYTCTKDLLMIARLALQNKTISKYTGRQQATVVFESGQSITWINTNLLLDPASKYYHPDACGMKTGTTSKAGACLMSAFQSDHGLVIVGVFGSPTNETRYEDTLHLYNTYS